MFIQNVEESCPEKSGFAIIVQHIGPAYTTFLSSFNEEMKISNVVLADKTVLNHSRSPKPALRIAVHLSARTPPGEIAALREAVFAYVDEHPKAWRYASIVHIDGYELEEGWVRLAMWLTSASPGGFHDWKTLYQDRHRFYMWLHTYLDEANLHYCKPTVPLLQIKNNADDIYNKKRQ